MVSKNFEITLNYNVSNGDTFFDINPKEPLGGFDVIYIQILYSGLDASDSTINLYRSATPDTSKFILVPNSTLTLDNTQSAADYNICSTAATYFRLKFTKGANTTTGTIEKLIIVLKDN